MFELYNAGAHVHACDSFVAVAASRAFLEGTELQLGNIFRRLDQMMVAIECARQSSLAAWRATP